MCPKKYLHTSHISTSSLLRYQKRNNPPLLVSVVVIRRRTPYFTPPLKTLFYKNFNISTGTDWTTITLYYTLLELPESAKYPEKQFAIKKYLYYT
jgi:hypothetical protein